MTKSPNPVPIETLLRYRGWLRSLIRELVSDPDVADDVEQATWAAAIRRPPRHQRGLGAWLARVAASRVKDSYRREQRRDHRETSAARTDPSPSTEELVGRAELQRRVADAVLALKEPYRTAVLQRYFDDRSPAEIADMMGLPLETVRTHLKRGKAKLRVILDREYGGRRRPWVLAGIPLLRDGVPVEVARAAATGALMMSTKKITVGVVVALLLLGAGWFALELTDSGVDRTATTPKQDLTSATVDVSGDGPTLVGGNAAQVPEGKQEPSRAEQPELPVPAAVTGLVCLVAGGRGGGVDAARIHVLEGGRSVDRLNARKGKTRIAELPPGRYVVKVVHFHGSDPRSLPPSQEVTVRSGAVREVRFMLPEFTDVRFTAVDEGGARREFSLSIWRLDAPDSPLYMPVTALFRRASDGRLWSGRLLPGRYAAKLASQQGHGATWTQFDVVKALPVKETVVLAKDGVSLRVRFVHPWGPTNRVHFNVNRLTEELLDTANWSGRTTLEGTATTAPLPAGNYAVWLWDQKRMRRLTLGSSQRQSATIALDAPAGPGERARGARVHVRISNRDGRAIRDVTVVAHRVDELRSDALHVFARVSGDNTYRFEGLAPGRYRFWVPYSLYRRVKYREFTSGVVEIRAEEPVQKYSFRLRR